MNVFNEQFTTILPKDIIQSPPHVQPQWQILLVEDNQLVQMAVQNQLTALNCKVDLAANGVQALERTDAARYDLIFLDIELPDLNGYEIARRIRRQINNPNHRTPIIAQTTLAGANYHQRCLDAGMQRVLIKPLQPDQAYEVLAALAGNSIKGNAARRCRNDYTCAPPRFNSVPSTAIAKIKQADIKTLLK